jgi:hypothetical protein
MPVNAFIVRPFGIKELQGSNPDFAKQLEEAAATRKDGVVDSLRRDAPGGPWTARLDFDALDKWLITPALQELGIRGETTEAVVKAGNIREDMFNRLVTADLVIADLTIYNPNVYYELGVRQAFRDKYTFLIRCDLSNYPFDLQTDRYFAYSLDALARDPDRVVKRLVKALRSTLTSTDADSPVFKLLPQLESEDRARFISVPEDFREEVEWARHQRRSEHLSLMATECDGFLWEVEGLRLIGRAQFDCNFIPGARATWEQIVGRYPDDVEGNSILSTIYQRTSDMKKSEQALSRVARTRALTPPRLSQLRALSGRNLKAAWIEQWQKIGKDPKKRQRAALVSPLLERAYEAFHEAFKLDLNNSYAGLNALTMLVIQTELASRLPEDWKAIQREPYEATRELSSRGERIRKLIAALELAVESDRDRLRQQGQVDPWFNLLEAAVACVVSSQPEYVARLYEQAVLFAPESAEAAIRGSLEVYRELDIGASAHDRNTDIGSIGENVERTLELLSGRHEHPVPSAERQNVLLFVGLRVDASNATLARLPASRVEAAERAIEDAISREIRKIGGNPAFGIAGGASGGDLLFHEICRRKGIPTRLCMPLRKPQHVGTYVVPAGRDWVERFTDLHRHILHHIETARGTPQDAPRTSARNDYRLNVFTDSHELPRWLQGKPLYNVGRRNNLWMLQHAQAAAHELGAHGEVTLLALWDDGGADEGGIGGIGGIGDVIRTAAAQGIKVVSIPVPPGSDGADPASAGAAAAPLPPPPTNDATDPAADANALKLLASRVSNASGARPRATS